MDIILVSPQYLGTITGSGGLYVLELSRELSAKKMDVTVLTLGIGDAKDEEIVELDPPSYYKSKLKCQIKLKRFWTSDSRNIRSPYEGNKDIEIRRLKEFKRQVLDYLISTVKKKSIVHLNGHFSIPSLAKSLKQYPHFKIVTSLHSLESISEARKGNEGVGRYLINYIQNKEKDAINYSDYVLLWSNALKEEISWMYPELYNENRIKVIPFGLQSSFIIDNYISDETFNLILDKYKIKENYIFYLGRIDPSKGIEYLIQAFPKLMKKLRKQYGKMYPRYSLLIAGLLEEKNNWYNEKLQKMRNKIHKKEIRELVQIFTDNSVIIDKEILYKKAAIFSIPSILSPFGMSLIEAIVKQTPFVVSGIEGILEILNVKEIIKPFSIVNGGVVVDFRNPTKRIEYLIEALYQVLISHSQFKDSIIPLRKKIIEKYSWQKIIQDVIKLYKKLMTK